MMSRYTLTISLLLCSFAVHSHELAKPVFDNRQWELGWSIEQEPNRPKDGQVFEEYVLKGEVVNNWSELVTIQYFPELNKMATLEKLEELNKKELLNKCPSIKWHTLSSNDNERIWEWTFKDCKTAPAQSDLTRVVKGEKGIFVFHYGIKKSPMPEDKKKTWEANLKAIQAK